jgi:hypothetical protein
MTLPALPNFEGTRVGLHRAAQVIGVVKRTVHEPLPNWAHLGIFPTQQGVTTGQLTIGELLLDFGGRAVVYKPNHSGTATILLDRHTQVSLADAVLEVLADAGHNLSPDRAKIGDQSPLNVDAALAADYANALYRIYTAVARFRAKLLGPMSPAIVWSHGFDLSFLWFRGPSWEEQKDAHLNFGFPPGSPGLDRPYLYSYIWPLPDNVTSHALPKPAHWHTQGWTGVVVPYDEIAREHDPENVIESVLEQIFRTLSPMV